MMYEVSKERRARKEMSEEWRGEERRNESGGVGQRGGRIGRGGGRGEIFEFAAGRKTSQGSDFRGDEDSRPGVRVAGELLLSDAFTGEKRNKLALVQRVPLGVIVAIPPYNYPLNLAGSKVSDRRGGLKSRWGGAEMEQVGPALMAGNSVVMKPPSAGAVTVRASRSACWTRERRDGEVREEREDGDKRRGERNRGEQGGGGVVGLTEEAGAQRSETTLRSIGWRTQSASQEEAQESEWPREQG
eukprot:765499-Hanusia_phi.AAC.5